MLRSLVSILRCPRCSDALSLDVTDENDIEVITGGLSCAACAQRFAISNGIPRFVDTKSYADNFGVQWHRFRQTQLDSYSGVPISKDRFLSFTKFTRDDLDGEIVLDCGCGAGRFAEIALDHGARVMAIDISNAVDAARDNLGSRGGIDFIQADILNLPFAPGTFSLAYCLGVLQHTPDPRTAFFSLADAVAPGGKLAVDVYAKQWVNAFLPKYWVRSLTRQLKVETTSRIVETWFAPLYAVSSMLGRLPKIGRKARWMVPVANYEGVLPLSRQQARDWAYLDTLDMWAPAHDYPQDMETMRKWFEAAGFENIEVERPGFVVARGVKG